ncbi:hypothetical protein IF2G_06678 [Cordyceps javanica]|nr:hypothetical protein IF2G_06678 [Cordyceps javanica]
MCQGPLSLLATMRQLLMKGLKATYSRSATHCSSVNTTFPKLLEWSSCRMSSRQTRGIMRPVFLLRSFQVTICVGD